MSRTFHRLRDQLGLDQVSFEPVTLQAFEPREPDFGVVLLHDSVNHLDEQACTNLRKDERARSAYRAIFAKLARLSRPRR